MTDYFARMEALAASQGGYFYPWASRLGAGDGESFYTDLVLAHLSPSAVVVEAGCGHGPDIPLFAPGAGRYVAYDAVEGFIAIAGDAVRRAGLANVELVRANSAPRYNGGMARLPAEGGEVDLVISRRGPTNWIADARRACRSGAALIQINPLPSPPPAWNDDLPETLRFAGAPDAVPVRIAGALKAANLALHSAWTFDVPEWLPAPSELYRLATWLGEDEARPAFDAVEPELTRLFARHAGPDGLEVRHRRYVWKAVVD